MVSPRLPGIHGRSADATTLYEAAITQPRPTNAPENELWANELYARFWPKGDSKRSLRCSWLKPGRAMPDGERRPGHSSGAQYQHLLTPCLAPGYSGQRQRRLPALDVSTVLKAARASLQSWCWRISCVSCAELPWRTLAPSEGFPSGAGRPAHGCGRRIGRGRSRERHWAEACGVDHSSVLGRDQLRARDGESLVVGNGCAGRAVCANDPYIVSTKPRSLMCVPIIQHGMLGGILYLENNLCPRCLYR